MAVELALELWVNQRNGGGAAGGRGCQAFHGTAGTAQVFVWRVHHHVGVGRVVDGGDLSVTDAQLLVHHFHHRCQAVGGARRRRDDAVFGRVVQLVVHADHDVEHVAHLHRRGHNDALGAAVQVALNGFGRQEFAGALQHHVYAQIAPGDVCRCGVRAEREPLGADGDGVVALGANALAPLALHRVKRQQVGGGGSAAFDFIQVHHFQAIAAAWVVQRALGGAHGRAQRQTANAAHSVDTDFHDTLSFISSIFIEILHYSMTDG